jgi:transposase InsO family protein
MDFTGPFVEVGGFDYVLLVICRMTGMVHLIPTRTDATAKQVAEVYVKEVVRLHGIPESIVSDRDMKFTSKFWRELSKILGQRLLMSTAYHPQTDGSSERAIQVMSQMLQSVINDHQMNWVEQLPLVEFAMNSAENESTGAMPFEVNYGWLPRIIRGVEFGSTRPGIKQFAENISNVIDKTFD